MVITSEPSGALVWLNDVEIGRTPIETDFKFYGVYDVRLALDGYEPLVTSREAVAPVSEWVGIDLLTAGLPLRNRVEWHFPLTPVAEAQNRAKAHEDVVKRAKDLRAQSTAPSDATKPAEAPKPADTPKP